MSKQSAADILKNYGQRITEKRIALLEILLIGDAKAFALSDIEKQLTVSMDRVTVYRTLQTFEETGLVIKMVDHKGTCLYMLNLEDHNKLSAHPHLHCTACGEIVCLPSLPEAYLKKLEDYQIDEIYFLMEGKCRACSTE
ncbi:MAG: transcriptional repressor [Mameliella sp.]|nr:transcriptional repressor [Phaeodactylibacter sp.]